METQYFKTEDGDGNSTKLINNIRFLEGNSHEN